MGLYYDGKYEILSNEKPFSDQPIAGEMMFKMDYTNKSNYKRVLTATGETNWVKKTAPIQDGVEIVVEKVFPKDVPVLEEPDIYTKDTLWEDKFVTVNPSTKSRFGILKDHIEKFWFINRVYEFYNKNRVLPRVEAKKEYLPRTGVQLLLRRQTVYFTTNCIKFN